MFDTENFYKELVDNLFDGVYFVNRDRIITYWNKGAERLTGYPPDHVIGRSCRDNILNHVTANGMQLCLTNCPLAATMEDGNPREAEVFLHHSQGHRVPVIVRSSPIRNKSGEIIGAVETFNNNEALFSSRKKIWELNRSAMTDPLTVIGNRRYIEERLRTTLFDIQTNETQSGLLFLDIDGFKKFNDTYGHDVGDQVLKTVAQTLKANLRATDFLGRWGGEEFVIIINDIPNAQTLLDIGDKLRALVECSGIKLNGTNLSVTVSMGGTMIDQQNTIDENVQRADQLMYKSKQAGKNRVTVG